MTREEAIKKVRQMSLPKETMEILEALAPELAESGDEKIRKHIIEILNSLPGCYWHGEKDKSDCVTYLEKQKEKKPATIEQVYENFLSSDTLKSAKENKYIRAQLLWELMHNGIITEVDYQYLTDDKHKPWTAEEYRIAYQKGFDMSEQLKQKEQKPEEKPVNWTELTWEDINYLEDLMAKVHYEFRNGIGAESFGKEVLEKFREHKGDEYLDEIEQKPAWSEEDEDFINMLILHFNYLIDKGGDSVETYKSYREKLKSLRPQPKTEWSEEDSDVLLQTAAILKANFDSDEKFEDCDYDCETLAGKLLEMRYRISPSWKPSEEQMGALERASTNKYLSAEQYDILVSLYEQLKKLI